MSAHEQEIITLSHNDNSINNATCKMFRKIQWLVFCFLTTCFANLEYLLTPLCYFGTLPSKHLPVQSQQ